jgi:hypothetical protein
MDLSPAVRSAATTRAAAHSWRERSPGTSTALAPPCTSPTTVTPKYLTAIVRWHLERDVHVVESCSGSPPRPGERTADERASRHPLTRTRESHLRRLGYESARRRHRPTPTQACVQCYVSLTVFMQTGVTPPRFYGTAAISLRSVAHTARACHAPSPTQRPARRQDYTAHLAHAERVRSSSASAMSFARDNPLHTAHSDTTVMRRSSPSRLVTNIDCSSSIQSHANPSATCHPVTHIDALTLRVNATSSPCRLVTTLTLSLTQCTSPPCRLVTRHPCRSVDQVFASQTPP